MNLYILAGALRSKRPVPRYLPSAAAARKRLLDRMAEVEVDMDEAEREFKPRGGEKGRRWADVYREFSWESVDRRNALQTIYIVLRLGLLTFH
jgi:hypothetical protein